MKFYIISIFPSLIENYFNDSILMRARKKKLIKINFINPRDFTDGRHKSVDDRPFGGGPGMVMKAEPIIRAVDSVLTGKRKKKVKIVILSPRGRQFTASLARSWAKRYSDIVLICGRYEGIDNRVKAVLKADEISIGPYILTGGELPAAVVVDSISRHIPEVLSKRESLEDGRGIGIPVYTRPSSFRYRGKEYKVPKVLLGGDHRKIEEWRRKRVKR